MSDDEMEQRRLCHFTIAGLPGEDSGQVAEIAGRIGARFSLADLVPAPEEISERGLPAWRSSQWGVEWAEQQGEIERGDAKIAVTLELPAEGSLRRWAERATSTHDRVVISILIESFAAPEDDGDAQVISLVEHLRFIAGIPIEEAAWRTGPRVVPPGGEASQGWNERAASDLAALGYDGVAARIAGQAEVP